MSIVQTILDDVGKVIDVFGATAPTATESAATLAGKITVGDARGIIFVAKAIPVSELQDIIFGTSPTGTKIDETFDVTEKVIASISSAFPVAIPQAALIEMLLKVGNVGVDFAIAHGVTISPGQGDLSYEDSPNFKDR